MSNYLLLNGKHAELLETENVLSEVNSIFNTPAQAVSENLTMAHPFLLWFNDWSQNRASADLNTGASAILKAMTGDDDTENIHGPVAITGLFVEGTELLTSLETRAIRVLRGKFGISIDLETKPRKRWVQ